VNEDQGGVNRWLRSVAPRGRKEHQRLSSELMHRRSRKVIRRGRRGGGVCGSQFIETKGKKVLQE